MMNLILVTFETDLTQFLIDTELRDKAIDIAIESNKLLGDWDEIHNEIEDRSLYTVENVDFALLNGLLIRNDCIGMFGNAIVFTN